MAKVQFSDVTPPEKRSIRDIPIPAGGKRKTPIVIKPGAPKSNLQSENVAPIPTRPISNQVEINKESGPYEYYYPKEKEIPLNKVAERIPSTGTSANIKGKPKSKKLLFAVLTLVVIAAFIVGMMTVFSSATIVVTPKSQNVEVAIDISATVEKSEDSVRYEVVKLSKSKTASVPATGEEAAEVKASGKIIVYNNFSSESQRLIVRTRFETADGLVYRIPESITVPGKSVKNGVETPGSIEVEVFADEAGEKYNIKKTDFTVPGFKTDAERYAGFYARSSTDMTGGFVGKRKTVTASDKQTALASMDGELQDLLQKELQAKVPEGLTLLQNSIIFESAELPQKEESGNVTIGKEITAYGILLNSEDLSQMIVKKYVSSPDWTNIEAEVKDFSTLSMGQKPADIETSAKLDLEVSGNAKVQARVDSAAITERLAGIPRKNTAQIMDEFIGISSITAAIRPIWKQSFPTDPQKITIQMAPLK